LTTTAAPTLPSALAPAKARPSLACRSAMLAFTPFLRRLSIAFCTSPSASVRAFLHSIMPSPVLDRSSLTIAAVIAAMWVAPCVAKQRPRITRIARMPQSRISVTRDTRGLKKLTAMLRLSRHRLAAGRGLGLGGRLLGGGLFAAALFRFLLGAELAAAAAPARLRRVGRLLAVGLVGPALTAFDDRIG